MSGGLRRGLADFICCAIQAVLPPSLKTWGRAIRCETANIPDDTHALLFALDSARGLLPHAITPRLLHPIAALIGAVTLGLAYMAIAGAPTRYLGMNIAALGLGLLVIALFGRLKVAERRWGPPAIALMASVLVVTALLGDRVDGVARWVNFGGISVQPSLILLPVMLIVFARACTFLSTISMIAAAIAVALQPDRAMAGMLASGLAGLMMLRPERRVVVSFGASIFGFIATLVQADTLPAAPFVDQILFSAFDSHIIAGAAVWSGSILPLAPAIVGWWRDPSERTIYAIFGVTWFAVIVAAAIGSSPTPIVGYGGSAIIGYALSLLALPKLAREPVVDASPTGGEAETLPLNQHLRAVRA